jgi:acetyltransferase EpsM
MNPSPHAVRDLILIGGGEHARVVLDAARLSGEWNVLGYVDPLRSPAMERWDIPYLGSDSDIRAVPARGNHVIAIGGIQDRAIRRRLAAQYRDRATWATLIHPRAVVASGVSIGDGVVLLAASVVNPGARIGDHVIVNTGAIVEHDVELGSFVHIGPGVVVGGGARIGSGTIVGLGARIRDHVVIGEDVFVGMGAVVVGPVASGATVVGVPARPLRRGAASSGATQA